MEKIYKDKINKKWSILKGDGGDVLFDEGGGSNPSFNPSSQEGENV